MFLHGGYWRSLSSKEFSCVALGPHAIGVTTVVVNYALTPKVSIDEITRQARAAVAWVLRHIERYGGNPQHVVLGGHSAGAQLAAMCLQTAWDEDYDLPTDPLAGAVLVSGVYDLYPLRFSAMQPQLQLDDGVIRRNSPLFGVRACETRYWSRGGARKRGNSTDSPKRTLPPGARAATAASAALRQAATISTPSMDSTIQPVRCAGGWCARGRLRSARDFEGWRAVRGAVRTPCAPNRRRAAPAGSTAAISRDPGARDSRVRS